MAKITRREWLSVIGGMIGGIGLSGLGLLAFGGKSPKPTRSSDKSSPSPKADPAAPEKDNLEDIIAKSQQEAEELFAQGRADVAEELGHGTYRFIPAKARSWKSEAHTDRINALNEALKKRPSTEDLNKLPEAKRSKINAFYAGLTYFLLEYKSELADAIANDVLSNRILPKRRDYVREYKDPLNPQGIDWLLDQLTKEKSPGYMDLDMKKYVIRVAQFTKRTELENLILKQTENAHWSYLFGSSMNTVLKKSNKLLGFLEVAERDIKEEFISIKAGTSLEDEAQMKKWRDMIADYRRLADLMHQKFDDLNNKRLANKNIVLETRYADLNKVVVKADVKDRKYQQALRAHGYLVYAARELHGKGWRNKLNADGYNFTAKQLQQKVKDQKNVHAYLALRVETFRRDKKGAPDVDEAVKTATIAYDNLPATAKRELGDLLTETGKSNRAEQMRAVIQDYERQTILEGIRAYAASNRRRVSLTSFFRHHWGDGFVSFVHAFISKEKDGWPSGIETAKGAKSAALTGALVWLGYEALAGGSSGGSASSPPPISGGYNPFDPVK